MSEDFTGRRWEVEVEAAGEHAERQREERESEKDKKKAEKVEKDALELLQAWARQPQRTATKGTMRGVMGGWSGGRINLAVAFLVDKRKLFATEVEVPTGRGGLRTAKSPGYVAVSDSEGSNGKGG